MNVAKQLELILGKLVGEAVDKKHHVQVRGRKQISLTFNTAGATTKDLSNGYSRFQISPPLYFGSDSKGIEPEVGLISVTYTNFFKNITAALGNNKFYYSDNPADDTKYSVTIPDGSYETAELNTLLTQHQINTVGVGGVKFEIKERLATQKTYIEFAAAAWYVYWQAADTPFAVAGWTTGQYVPASKVSTAGYVEDSPNDANYDTVTAVNVKTNLTNEAFYNGKQGDILYTSIPDSPVGAINVDKAAVVSWVGSDILTRDVDEGIFQLVDQNNTPIDFGTQNYTVKIGIRQ